MKDVPINKLRYKYWTMKHVQRQEWLLDKLGEWFKQGKYTFIPIEGGVLLFQKAFMAMYLVQNK